MMNIEIKDSRTASAVKHAIEGEVGELKRSLCAETSAETTAQQNDINMITITELVTDINTLTEVAEQINVKLQFATAE